MFKQVKRIKHAVKFIQQFTLLTDDRGSVIVMHRRSGVTIKFGGDGQFAIESPHDLCLDGKTIRLNSLTNEQEGTTEGYSAESKRYYADCFGVGDDGREVEGGCPLPADVSS